MEQTSIIEDIPLMILLVFSYAQCICGHIIQWKVLFKEALADIFSKLSTHSEAPFFFIPKLVEILSLQLGFFSQIVSISFHSCNSDNFLFSFIIS